MSETKADRWRRLAEATSLVALASVAILLLAASLRRIWGVDFWWQTAAGRWIAEHGFPRGDVFSFTALGEPWIELRWLYCVTLDGLVAAFGPPAAVLGKCALVLASFGLVVAATLRRGGTAVASVALLVAVLASSQRFFVRPELVTYLLFALYVWILRDYLRRESRWILLLPVLQLVWVNSHTLFVLGPALVGLLCVVLLGEELLRRGDPDAHARRRRLITAGGILLACALACLVNPWGLAGALFPFRLFGELRGGLFAEGIGEFRGPFDFGSGYQALFYYRLLIGLCIASIAANWRRLDPFWLLLAASQFYLSWLAIRNLPLFALAAVPLVIDNFQRSSIATAPRWARPRAVAAVLAAAAVVGVGGWQIWRLATDRFHVEQNDTNQFGVGIATSRYPVGATRFLDEHALDGPIFHTMAEGSYLLAHGHRVFIDPRLEVYGEARFGEYLGALRDRGAFEALLERHGIRVLLLDVRSRGVRFALASRRWRPVYADEVAVVLVPFATTEPPSLSAPSVLAATIEDVRSRLPPVAGTPPARWWQRVRSPRPYAGFAQVLIQLGLAREAIPFLHDAVLLAPDREAALNALVVAYQQTGDTAAERAALERLIASGSENAAALRRLAVLRAAAGEASGARELLEHAVVVDPGSVAAWTLLGRVAAQQGDHDAALRAFGRAVELAPDDASLRANLGRVLINSERPREGLAELERALELAPRNVGLLRDLAVLHAALGDAGKAREYVRRALAVRPADPQLRALAERLGER